MQNKREYRSKFLKEFQQEYGTNTLPDYDEIYKRYDKLKKENKRLNNIIDELEKYINYNVEITKEAIVFNQKLDCDEVKKYEQDICLFEMVLDKLQELKGNNNER